MMNREAPSRLVLDTLGKTLKRVQKKKKRELPPKITFCFFIKKIQKRVLCARTVQSDVDSAEAASLDVTRAGVSKAV